MMKKFLHHCINYFKKEEVKAYNPTTSLGPKVLTDENDIKKIQPYLDLLKKTLNDSEITNIALAGGYGSGKSTIIKTFQYYNPQFKYLNISLASFKDIRKNGEKDTSKDLERHLEVSILQQIFYHVKPSDIPDSRFKRIINITDTKLWVIALGMIVWTIATIILFKFDYLAKINPSSWDFDKPFDIFALLLHAVFFAGIGLFSKDLVRLFSNSKINKFTIKGELELGDKLDKSVFNEHLEEIIYFFERKDYDVVVIEDLDRFESTDIFTKLREINILLNQSKLINRTINFLYAIRDEMFLDKSERVKFFEYIIPVIPFINPSNASDQLEKLISEAELQDVLSKDFREDVVTFIDDIDMRLLTNIFHEYVLYRRNLDEGLNQDELFAMITYKNLYPDDFGKLNNRSGKLYEFLSNKGKYIDELITKNDDEIQVLRNKLQSAENEPAMNIWELRAVYINAIHSLLPNAVAIYVGDEKTEFQELLDDEVFDEFSTTENIKYQYYTKPSYYHQLSESTSKVSFSDIEKRVGGSYTYQERVEMIDNKSTERQRILREELQGLQTKKVEIENWTLKRVFDEVDIEPHLTPFDNNLLVRNLLLNGYINENYNDYISLFHEVSITKEDFAFIRNVKSGINTAFDYELTKIENLIKKIPQKYFSRDTTLNYTLMDFLGENYAKYESEYGAIIKNIGSGKKRGVEFLDGYITRGPDTIAIFIRLLTKSWKGFWKDISEKRKYTPEKTKHYLKLIIEHADTQDIVAMATGSNLVSFIEKQPDFLELVNGVTYLKRIKGIMTAFDIRFDSLVEPSETSRELFDHVYEHNRYKINRANISLFALDKGKGVTQQTLDSANYTTICESGCESLKSYVEDNIDEYVKNVLLKNPDNTQESESRMIELLNMDDLDIIHKIDLIETQGPVISDMSKIEDITVMSNLLEFNKISPEWPNLFAYYESLEEQKFDDILIGFLNTEANFMVLSDTKINAGNERKEDFIKKFTIDLLQTDSLDMDPYRHLVDATGYRWTNFSVELLSGDKVKFLIEHPALSTTPANYGKLKEHFLSENFHILLIEQHFTRFIGSFDEFELDEEDTIKLLRSNTITPGNKLQLLELLDDERITDSAEISKLACTIYAGAPSASVSVSFEVLESFFSHSPSKENRIRVLNSQLDELLATQVQSLVVQLGKPYTDIFKKQHKPKFQNTDYHRRLFGWLQSQNLIKSVEPYRKDESLLRVIANYV